jgi:hypothetical protein
MSKNLFIFCMLVSMTFIRCTSNMTEDELDVLLRVKNVSQSEYKDVFVSFDNPAQGKYGNLSGGKFSTYLSFPYCYRYGFVSLKIEDKVFTLQPIDFVGEEKFEKGKFTFEIDLDKANQQLLLKFKED